MRETPSDFRDALQELIGTSPEPMDHPSPDRWLAYHRGELSADEEALLQEHLARCRDCFDLSAAAAEFAQPDEEPLAGQEADTAALWRRLQPQLDPSPDPSRRNVRRIPAGPRQRPSRRHRLPTALAASFFVAFVGMTAWNVRMQSDLAALRAPQANAPIFNVFGGERLPAGQALTVPAGPRMFVFHPDHGHPVYRLAIRDAATGRELSSAELRPDEDFALTLYLPEGLRPGRYRMELADGSGRVLETHLLRVTMPGQGG